MGMFFTLINANMRTTLPCYSLFANQSFAVDEVNFGTFLDGDFATEYQMESFKFKAKTKRKQTFFYNAS